MTITMHVCRGNFRSTWISSGGYEPVAETLLAKLNIDGYFLEYDTERAGGFEPLRFLPKGNKIVVLGLVTSKSGTLESKGDVKKRIDEATKYVALDQLALSPAMRLRLNRGRQCPHRGSAMGEARRDRRNRPRGMGLSRRRPEGRIAIFGLSKRSRIRSSGANGDAVATSKQAAIGRAIDAGRKGQGDRT